MSDQIDCIYIVHNHDHITSEGSTIYTATSSVLRPSIGGKTFNTGGKKDGRKLMNCVTFTEQHSHIYMLSRSKPSSVRLHCIPYCTGWEWNTVQPTFCTGPGVKSLICIPEWLKSGDRTWNLVFLSEYNPTAGLMFQSDEYKHDFSATELMRTSPADFTHVVFHVSQSAKRSGSYLTVIRNCSSLCQEKHKSSILARRSWMECNRQNVCCEKRVRGEQDGTVPTGPAHLVLAARRVGHQIPSLFFSFLLPN